MEEIKTYKCPNCNGVINFDPNTQKLKCPYCDTEIDINSLKIYEEAKSQDDNDNFGWEDVDLSDILSQNESKLEHYVCENCGGEILGDASMSSSMCPYCGNNVIIKKQFEGMLKPKYIIPFKYNYEEAKNAMLEHFKGKILLPKDFKTKNKLEKLIGIYVPYWLFDCDADGGVRYRATRTRTYISSDYQYTETMHFLLYRQGKMSFEKVPVDASLKLDDTMLESLEPYNFNDVLDFDTAYLMGYLSDRFEVKPDDCKERANERIRNSLVDELAKTTIGYTTVIPENVHLDFSDGQINYALLPVYILHTKYHNKDYIFMMNGQTGKFVGDLPGDNKRFILILVITFIISFTLIFLLANVLL